MKPEKMTDEDLAYCMRCAKECGAPESARRLGSHIAALTAERDEAHADYVAVASLAVHSSECREAEGPDCICAIGARPHPGAAILAERDALRERVQALENELAAERDEVMMKHAALMGLDARLAAIRQLCEGAPVCAEPSTVKGEHKLGTNSAPTTAEAFAKVREFLDDVKAGRALGINNERRAFAALSLLERRMGAMGRHAQRLITDADGSQEEWTDAIGERTVRVRWEMVEALRATLTDAPPVFTLEEVDRAMEGIYGLQPVLNRLAAMRRKP